MNKYKYYYSTNEKQDNPEYRYEFESKYFDTDDLDIVAEQIADHDWCHSDGWEYKWPVVYYIWNDEHEYLGAYQVHVDMLPSFTACEFEDKK